MLTHVLLHCSFHLDFQKTFTENCSEVLFGRSEAHYTLLLLSGQDITMLLNMGKFCVAIVKICAGRALVNLKLIWLTAALFLRGEHTSCTNYAARRFLVVLFLYFSGNSNAGP